MKFWRQDLTISGDRRLYLYHFADAENHSRQRMFTRAVASAWKERAEAIEEWFAPVTQAMQQGLVGKGGLLLDIGCGAGSMPVGSEWTRIGVDVSAEVLTPRFPAIVAGCNPLPLRSGVFDAAISRFAVIFASDVTEAIKETRRVVVPGGTFVFSAWRSEELNASFDVPGRILGEQLGIRPISRSDPSAFRLADVDETARLLSGAGFDPQSAMDVELPYLARMDADSAFQHLMTFAGGIRTMFDRVALFDRERVKERIVKALDESDRTGYATVWISKAIEP